MSSRVEPEADKAKAAIAPEGEWTGAYARRRGSRLVHRYKRPTDGAPESYDRSLCGAFMGIKCILGPIQAGERECYSCRTGR